MYMPGRMVEYGQKAGFIIAESMDSVDHVFDLCCAALTLDRSTGRNLCAKSREDVAICQCCGLPWFALP